MTTRPSSTKLRRQCFDANRRTDEHGKIFMICHICNGPIWPQKGDAWECDHVTRRVLCGDDDVSNLKPAHYKCHRTKTIRDIRENAKGKRESDNYYGIRKRGWNGKWKRKLNGETVER